LACGSIRLANKPLLECEAVIRHFALGSRWRNERNGQSSRIKIGDVSQLLMASPNYAAFRHDRKKGSLGLRRGLIVLFGAR